jgi:D-serine deaminase-like pyridoxal phosphate-dependent protein
MEPLVEGECTMNLLQTPTEHSSRAGRLEQPVPLEGLDTPALLLDSARLGRNLDGMAALAAGNGVRLRPHAKSHKTPGLAFLQQERGAVGVCTAKVSEAAVFLEAGVEDLVVAYPLVGAKAERLASLAALHPRARLAGAADSEEGLEALGHAASRHGVTLTVWLKVDSGLHRAGVLPQDPRLEALARRARHTPGVRLAGLLTHAGHVYRADPRDVPGIGRREGEALVEAAQRLNRAGLGPLEVALGSTPTVPHAARVEGVNEIHPGVYVFGDRQQVALEAMASGDVALTVLATVVSRPDPGRWVLDCGSKTLSSDRGAHGTEMVRGYGIVRGVAEHRGPDPRSPLPFAGSRDPSPFSPAPILARLSEEHGVVETEGEGFPPGTRVEVIPNHACAVVNLALTIHVTEGEGADRHAVASWPVAARARVV